MLDGDEQQSEVHSEQGLDSEVMDSEAEKDEADPAGIEPANSVTARTENKESQATTHANAKANLFPF